MLGNWEYELREKGGRDVIKNLGPSLKPYIPKWLGYKDCVLVPGNYWGAIIFPFCDILLFSIIHKDTDSGLFIWEPDFDPEKARDTKEKSSDYDMVISTARDFLNKYSTINEDEKEGLGWKLPWKSEMFKIKFNTDD